MPPRQTVLKPLGLITRPNELGAYPPGAMAVANNVLFRDSGQFQVSKNLSGAHELAAGSPDFVVRKLFALDSGIIFAALRNPGTTWTLEFTTGFGTIPPGMSGVGLLSDTGFISPIRMRDHFVLNGMANTIVSDVMAPATAADRAFRCAGMPQAEVGSFTRITVAAGAVAPMTTVGYCVLFRRDYANGYSVISTPSLIYRLINDSVNACNPELGVRWAALSGVREGDLVEIYRTDAVNAVLATTDPGTTCKLVLTHTLTAANIAAGFVSLLDTQAPGPLGETYGRELYTNPGQGGALSANRQPNISKNQSSYKGFAFFGNVIERPIWVFGVPAGMSNNTTGLVTDYQRTHGIGTRIVTANTVLGNATVAGVSPSHMLGIVPGQRLTFGGGGSFPGNVFSVQSVGPGTITFTGVATAGVAGATLHINDVYELDTGTFVISSLGGMLGTLSASANYELTCDQTVALRIGTTEYEASGFTVTVEPSRPWYKADITIRATNGQNYEPAVPEISAPVKTFTQTPRPNMLQWSHEQQPEHVPPSNSAFVGTGAIIGLASTRDALWIFCTDGLFRLSGDGGQWRIDQLDTTLVLSAPQCATVLRDSVYAYTNRGLVHIADDGFDELSDLVVGDILPGPAYLETASRIVERDETYDEIHVVDTALDAGAFVPTHYLFHTIHRCWSKLSFANVTALAYQQLPTDPTQETNGWMIIGQSPLGGLPPQYALFDQATTAVNLTATVQYQPFYEADPMVLKHWIDGTWLFELVDATRTINSSWRGVADGSAVLVAQLNGDSRATFGIPRRVAVAPTISPGITIVGGGVFTPPTCKGLSLRFQPLTEQQAYR